VLRSCPPSRLPGRAKKLSTGSPHRLRSLRPLGLRSCTSLTHDGARGRVDGLRAVEVCSVGGHPPSVCHPVCIRPPQRSPSTPPRVPPSGSYPTLSCGACPAPARAAPPQPWRQCALERAAAPRAVRVHTPGEERLGRVAPGCSRGCSPEDAGAQRALECLSAAMRTHHGGGNSGRCLNTFSGHANVRARGRRLRDGGEDRIPPAPRLIFHKKHPTGTGLPR